MAIRKIVTVGDDVLRKKSRVVTVFDQKLHLLLDDMRDTLLQADGLGLAAPQVGILKRAVVIRIGDEFVDFVNPEIIAAEGEQQELEGCLSIPGKWGITKRPAKVTIRAQDRNGNFFEKTGEGLLARAFCHETDHLDGVLYTDHALRILTPEELEKEEKRR
ncbi:peptide deformylase [Ethanoligenens harbinense]|uniref:Peptide deformylase n=1 Tax=Ethanoligenens harbinense (strain DSM 18485 / JCM 12961 / CGMCC 1.5033 / YUAN-3) TaxID=663278 RepID=E6U3N2_ETHHY|nr:peptide deformylase [Ethanoligenens harbinense]ADU27632.1 peptide deformylase [Ethanoligenens harbinense YUAN-3]AVQ96668.1 peptide deformylase [Ethanoligenens harbinense YUAN-3]AYF39328.1 peptide deformylase [Ethanoligenens harbinense]AYF42153.1 peptide deformylase [Ethanoligenens harbinense]QCN92908.1 peptide deformylase [Ethanoligenens harbinense]